MTVSDLISNIPWNQRKKIWAYSVLALPLLYFIIVRIAPMLYTFKLAFSEWDLFSQTARYVGLNNFIRLFEDPVFWKSLQNTGLYVVIGVPATLFISLAFALLINRVTRFQGLYKTLYFLPYIVSLVAVSWIWRWMLRPEGFFNSMLELFSFPTQGFLRDPNQALLCIVAATVWRYIGFDVIIFLAGLKNIPLMYYEAAKIDGADGWQIFWKITFPLLNPTIVVLTIMNTIYYLRIFTQVVNMTQQGLGGPLNSTKPLVLFLYNQGFRRFNMGYASTVTLVLFTLIVIVTLLQFRFVERKVSYY